MTTDSLPVLVPYSRFLEYQDRRRATAAESIRRDPTAPAQPLDIAEHQLLSIRMPLTFTAVWS